MTAPSAVLPDLLALNVARFNDARDKIILPNGDEYSGGGGGGGVTPSGDSDILYGNGPEGEQQVYPVSVNANSNEVAMRSNEGQLLAATVADDDPTSNGNDLINRDYAALPRAPVVLTGSRNLEAGDHGRMLVYNGATDIALEVLAGLPPGFSCRVIVTSTGQATLAPGVGVTFENTSALVELSGPYQPGEIDLVAADSVMLNGWTEP